MFLRSCIRNLHGSTGAEINPNYCRAVLFGDILGQTYDTYANTTWGVHSVAMFCFLLEVSVTNWVAQ